MTPNGLQKRLLDVYFDARTLEEEQGVNILYLGLGTLKWIDPNNAENVRYAPLILLPVSLERGSAAERIKLPTRQEEPVSATAVRQLVVLKNSVEPRRTPIRQFWAPYSQHLGQFSGSR
jgi:hypothetical protein